jgi:hypothetical protein
LWYRGPQLPARAKHPGAVEAERTQNPGNFGSLKPHAFNIAAFYQSEDTWNREVSHL